MSQINYELGNDFNEEYKKTFTCFTLETKDGGSHMS